jgi:hypothetical protein
MACSTTYRRREHPAGEPGCRHLLVDPWPAGFHIPGNQVDILELVPTPTWLSVDVTPTSVTRTAVVSTPADAAPS